MPAWLDACLGASVPRWLAISGQSNAGSGAQHTDPWPAGLCTGAYSLADPTTAYGHRDVAATGYGPELGVAAALSGARIVHDAHGGTSISSWLSTYQAQHLAVASRRGVTPTHLLWVQGEADATVDQATADAYQGRLETLLSAYRTAWGSGLVVVLTELRDHAALPYASTVRAAQQAVAAAQPATQTIDTSDLTMSGSTVHYDGAGQAELGRRFADVVLGA